MNKWEVVVGRASTKQEWGFSEPYSTFYRTDYNLFSYLNTQMFQFRRNP